MALRLLLISPHFPPYNSPGATRMLNLATGLKHLGLDITVVTVSSGSGPQDEIDVSEDIRVLRVPWPRTSRFSEWLVERRLNRIAGLCDIPDSGMAWNKVALEKCVEEHHRSPFDGIWTSANPVSVSLLGADLSRRFCIPLVAEFRDPWTQNPFRSWNSRLHYELERRQQRQVIETAEIIVMNTNTARKQLLAEFAVRHGKVRVITNGFNPADYPAATTASTPAATTASTPAARKLTFSHVGNLYSLAPPTGRNWKGRLFDALNNFATYERAPVDPLCRSPYYLFTAMEILRRERPDLGERMSFHQVGSVGASPSDFRQLVRQFGLDGMCDQAERVTRDEALRHEEDADVLVLAQMKPGDGSDCPAVAAKTYGALASGKPILGLVPAGDMRDLLVRSGRAAVAEPDDPSAIASAIDAILEGKIGSTRASEQLDLVPFQWPNIARQVLDTLREVVPAPDA